MGEKWMDEVAKAGGFEKHGAMLSEKAAKELHGFSSDINDAHKTGALTTLKEMFHSITEVAEGGSLEILKSFFELLAAFVRAGHAENMMELAKILFSEDNIKFWRELAEITGETNDGILTMARHLRDLREVIVDTRQKLGITNKEMKAFANILFTFINPVKLIGTMITTLRKEIELLISVIQGGLGGGGSSGGGGDQDEWWDPFGVF